MKKILLIIILLSILYAYLLVITNLPDKLTLFEGENIDIKTLAGINLQLKDKAYETIPTSSNIKEKGKTILTASIFNLEIKEIEVNVLEKVNVIPVGTMAGVKLYTSGVLVVGMSEIEGKDNKKYKPYENTGIEEGDTIIQINETEITSTAELIEKINESNGKNLNIKYIHDEETKQCSILPVETEENEYKIGLWVRDSAAGVGTVTFYEPESKSFGALGHGITDIDTEELINIASGEFITTRILDITKGQNGKPGKIQGTINEQKNIGKIAKNSKFGIYGKVDNISNLNLDLSKKMKVALREEIKIGKATIISTLDNNGPKEYEIEIEKIYKENNYDNKSMKIKVTDERLIEKTGGIIQGMSGSPIIQNGKFVGAITHVLVNNPISGYAVFGDLMIKQLKEVE